MIEASPKKISPPKEQALLTEVCSLFAEAEKQVKQTEITSDDIATPAINQLRYAGHHLTKFLLAVDESVIVEELHEAKIHCCRSLYDCYEAQVLYFLEAVADLEDHCADISISDTYSDYIELSTKCTEVQGIIQQAGIDTECRHEYYAELAKFVPSLRDFTRKIPIIRQEVNKKREQRDTPTRPEKTQINLSHVAWMLAALAFIVSCVMGYVSYHQSKEALSLSKRSIELTEEQIRQSKPLQSSPPEIVPTKPK